MKQSYRVIFVTFMLAAVLLSACGAGAVQSAGSKVSADVIVTGTIESINGTQWIVSGKTFTVDPSVIRDATFQVGDMVKVEGNARPDGTVVVTRVETPSTQDLANANMNTNAAFEDNSNNANTNDANINDDNSNNDNSSIMNINGDDNSNDNASISNANTNASDDHSRDNNTNDDHGGQGNSNDDGGGHDSNDDNSSNGG